MYKSNFKVTFNDLSGQIPLITNDRNYNLGIYTHTLKLGLHNFSIHRKI